MGTANADVYTCPSSTETTIIGLNIANILTVSITVNVQLINNDGDNVHIVKSAIVPVELVTGSSWRRSEDCDESSDILRITASQASAADVTLSVLRLPDGT